MKQYRARQAIKTKRDGKTVPAGTIVELEVTAEEERKLIEQGLIELLPSTGGEAPQRDLQRISPVSQSSDTNFPCLQQMGMGQHASVSIYPPFAGKGQRADMWADLFDGLGVRADQVFQSVQCKLAARQIPNAEAKIEILTDQGVVVEQRTFLTVKRGVATVALYVAPFGADLFVSWDTFVLPLVSRIRVAIAMILIACPLLSCCVLPFLSTTVLGPLTSTASRDPFGVLSGLLGTLSCLLPLVCCLLGIPTIVSLLILPPAFFATIRSAIIDRDPLAILRGSVSEFQQDDIIALEQAVHHTVLQTLDEIGIDTKIIPEATFNGVRRRVI